VKTARYSHTEYGEGKRRSDCVGIFFFWVVVGVGTETSKPLGAFIENKNGVSHQEQLHTTQDKMENFLKFTIVYQPRFQAKAAVDKREASKMHQGKEP